jgi:hypothetical protein
VFRVEGHGRRVILMASRALARAPGADDYLRVYGSILRQIRQPVICTGSVTCSIRSSRLLGSSDPRGR